MRRHDHGDFLAEIKLFLVDEVHVLNESRGSTLEVVISRMKAQGQNIRMILLSATVPNIRDIAAWIKCSSGFIGGPATVFEVQTLLCCDLYLRLNHYLPAFSLVKNFDLAKSLDTPMDILAKTRTSSSSPVPLISNFSPYFRTSATASLFLSSAAQGKVRGALTFALR